MDDLAVGLRLTWMGMGLVFLLLGALWGLIALLLRLDRSVPQAAAVASRSPAAAGPVAVADAGLDPQALAVIYTAVRLHRRALRQRAAPEVRVHPPGSLPSRWLGAGRSRQNRSWVPGKGRR
jgi:Na+-transporting methylmalonyl-CoA/oxaloacetate decarboxylase gamma subunit